MRPRDNLSSPFCRVSACHVDKVLHPATTATYYHHYHYHHYCLTCLAYLAHSTEPFLAQESCNPTLFTASLAHSPMFVANLYSHVHLSSYTRHERPIHSRTVLLCNLNVSQTVSRCVPVETRNCTRTRIWIWICYLVKRSDRSCCHSHGVVT